MQHIIRLALFIICALFIQNAYADTLTLNNGERLTGEVILKYNPDVLYFRTASDQNIEVPKNTIHTIAYGQPGEEIYVSRQNQAQTQTQQSAERISTGLYTFAQNQPAPTLATAPKYVPKPTFTDEEEEPSRPSGKKRKHIFEGADWSGRINAGASFQSGNSKGQTINLDGQAKAKWNKKHRATFKAEYNREKDSGTLTENNKSLDIIYDYFFKEKWFMNNALTLETDEVSQVDLRTNASIGIGYQPYEEDDLNLQFILSPSYLNTDFKNGSSEDSLAYRWNTDYDQKFWDGLIQIFHEHELLVPSDDTGAYLLDTKSGLRVPLKKGLVATAELDFDRDNNPSPGTKKDDTEYTIKLGYEW